MSRKWTQKALIRRYSEVRLVQGQTRRKRPETKTLFLAIAGEAEACLHTASWEEHVRNIQNLVTVIRERIRRHWEEMHESELDRLVRKARKDNEEAWLDGLVEKAKEVRG